MVLECDKFSFFLCSPRLRKWRSETKKIYEPNAAGLEEYRRLVAVFASALGLVLPENAGKHFAFVSSDHSEVETQLLDVFEALPGLSLGDFQFGRSAVFCKLSLFSLPK